MTVTDETTAPAEETTEETTGETGESTGPKRRPNDFTKFRDFHKEIADYINSHPEYTAAELGELSPNQVKAVLVLRTEFANTPEQIAARAERQREVEAKKAKYEGKSPEQIKALKAQEKAQEQAARFAAKAAEAERRAQELAAAAEGTGEDLAAVVQSQQNGSEPESDSKPKRSGIKRNR